MDFEHLVDETNPVKSEIRRFALDFGLEWDVHFDYVAPTDHPLVKSPQRSMDPNTIISIETRAEDFDGDPKHIVYLHEYSEDRNNPTKLISEDYLILAKAGLGEFNILLSNEPPIISNLGRPEPYASILTTEILSLCEFTSEAWALDLLVSRGFSNLAEQILLARHEKLLHSINSDKVLKDKLELAKTISEAAFCYEMFRRTNTGAEYPKSIALLAQQCRRRPNSSCDIKWQLIQSIYRNLPVMPSYQKQVLPILNQTTSQHLQVLAGLNFGYLTATKLHQSYQMSSLGGEYVWMHNEFYTGYKKPFIIPFNK